jgi:hypothetical protein
MKKSLAGFALLAVVAVVIYWGWHWMFPDPAQLIQKQFSRLAKTASFEPGESSLAKMAALQKLTGFFTPEIRINIDLRGYPKQIIAGRADLTALMSYVRSQLPGLSVEFLDLNIRLAEDRKSAVVNLTLRGKVTADNDVLVQEMNFVLKQIDGDWLIDRAETAPIVF